ncbi:Proteasome complex subunit Rpn13 ubiquitin receptor [Seminavis robusta]|uniref:Proteasome complex subunit Rpn13 ubiquitin receptor n=1 Tax=Seminavis robusta TaxID=568900 RepID=A0A9N8DIS8_9STRA|nr:Proteasome complex subunit Rpn13 ubiquitin receptor [Seminavis robusta]|eukprot:Sro143_g066690.1 Proteasome complex subunit Rpn13 ubiquitin receptor (397) ;mRNA; f:71547-72737
MYSDLFDHLGSNAGNSSSSSSNSNEKQLVTFKAGKMDLTLQENGNYWAAPDTRRGEIRIVWKTNENTLYWEWYDRREKSVADADRHLLFSLGGTSQELGTLEKVTNGPKQQAGEQPDRLYVWSRPPAAGATNPGYEMYWMQDASEEKDDEFIAKINQYLADPASANPNSSSTTAASSSGAGGGSSSSTTRNADTATSSSSSNDRQQVDALSNILENLGMPQNNNEGSSSASNNNAASTSSAARSGAGTLTLADLQGAMAGLQQQQSGPPGPPLQELVTPAAITSLLENEAIKKRLLELLPEEQRSEEFLEENLRSPQVQQTLRSLTMALLPDDTGSMDGYHSVLANFNMAEGAQEALQNNSNNPIQAFLECVLKSVEKEGKDDTEEEGKKDEETKE